MAFIEKILSNHVLIAPIIAWLLCQVIKFFINLIIEKKFDIHRLFGDGGMPSGHSATVTSLAVMCGYTAGVDSVAFAISMILAAIVMHDAVGVRRDTVKHAVSIKKLAAAVNKMFLERDKEIMTENLKILVGHTPLQVLFGAVTGLVVAASYILMIKFL